MREFAVLFALGLALFVTGIGAYGAARPAELIALVRRAWTTKPGLPVVVAVRLLLGSALVYVAPGTGHPRLLAALGWLSVASGVMAAFLGRRTGTRFVGWWADRPAGFTRAWSLVAMAFGALLVGLLLGAL